VGRAARLQPSGGPRAIASWKKTDAAHGVLKLRLLNADLRASDDDASLDLESTLAAERSVFPFNAYCGTQHRDALYARRVTRRDTSLRDIADCWAISRSPRTLVYTHLLEDHTRGSWNGWASSFLGSPGPGGPRMPIMNISNSRPP